MDQFYHYFRELSEGKLDITKTVEYRFVQTLQELDVPVSLQEFAAALDMTSIVTNFINLMTKGGLLSQSPQGLDTTINTKLTGEKPPEPTSQVEPETKSSSASLKDALQKVEQMREKQSISQSSNPNRKVPPPRMKTPVPKPPAASSNSQHESLETSSKPSETSQPQSPPKVPPAVTSGIPRPPISQQGTSQDEEDELPQRMQEKLNLLRKKTGSKKETGDLDKYLDLAFDELGSLEEELDD